MQHVKFNYRKVIKKKQLSNKIVMKAMYKIIYT